MKKIIKLVAISCSLCLGNVEGARVPTPEFHRLSLFEKGFPVMEAYSKTWDSSLTLAKNQKQLVNAFIQECCATSASRLLECLNNVGNRRKLADLGMPEEFDRYQYIDQDALRTALTNISAVPVGCKLLRVILARYRSQEDREKHDMKKLKGCLICKCDNDAEPRSLGGQLVQHEGIGIISVGDRTKTRSAWVSTEGGALLYQAEGLDLEPFHELLHFSHDIVKNDDDARYRRSIDLGDRMSFYSVEIELYPNDEELRTMYGVASAGFDTLCEAAYTMQKYGWVRCSHIGSSDGLDEMVVKLANQALYQRLSGTFHAYYHSAAFTESLPKFGINQYQCSDRDSVTGAKKAS